MNANYDLMDFTHAREMTEATQPIAGSIKRSLSGHYPLKGDTVASVSEVRRKRLKHRQGALEIGRQADIEAIATHAHDLVLPQYWD